MTVSPNGIVAPDLSEVVKGRLYLGNLAAALSKEERRRWSISHIVSVCPNFPSTGPNHLNIPVEDTDYDDLLIKLPDACAFIQKALEQGGRVLVHCVMGISRSSTVVAAFLMKTRKVPQTVAISQLKRVRPQVHPNYGFIKQLDVFAACEFRPSVSHPTYLSWKRRHARDVTRYLNYMSDTVAIIPDKLLLNSEFPTDPTQAMSLLSEIGVKHLLSVSPSTIPPIVSQTTQHRHIAVDGDENLALKLSTICSYISSALNDEGLVLIHSTSESRACMVAAAYLMTSRRYSSVQAVKAIEDILPLFNATRTFTRILDAFPTNGCTPSASIPSRGDLNSQKNSDEYSSSAELQKRATSILHDTGLDMAGFGDALNSICQKSTKPLIRVQ